MNNKSLVLNFLQNGNVLTAFEGFTRFGIVSVRDYVSMLRREGHPIASEWRCNLDSGKRFKEYFMTPTVK